MHKEWPRQARLLPYQQDCQNVVPRSSCELDDEDHVSIEPGDHDDDGSVPDLPRGKPWRNGMRAVFD